MAARPISSQLHGILDYTTGAALTALPSLLGLNGTRAGLALRAAGATTTAYSVLTKYELGAVKVLPYRGHLALDTVAAIGLAASPFALRTRDEGPLHWLPHVALGAFELAVIALSDPRGGGEDVTAQRAPVPTAVTEPATDAELAAPAEPAPAAGPPAFDVAADAHRAKTDRPEVVMPDGVEANAGIGARTIGVRKVGD